MDQILQVFGQEKIQQLDKMFMCGNYGDPAAGKNTLDIFQEFRKIIPDIVLGMNTNGGIQTTFWWYELAKIMNQPQDYVVFSIDGLESTNGTYRKNVVWNKLMSNARSFVEAGGSAHWDMLYIDTINMKLMLVNNWPGTWVSHGSVPRFQNVDSLNH